MDFVAFKVLWNNFVDTFKFNIGFDVVKDKNRVERQVAKLKEVVELLEADKLGTAVGSYTFCNRAEKTKAEVALKFSTFPYGYLRGNLKRRLSEEGIDLKFERTCEGDAIVSLHTRAGYVAMEMPVGGIENFLLHPGRLITG